MSILPVHEPVLADSPHSGTCGSCGERYWIRNREIGFDKRQADRINADGHLHLTTCLPQSALDRLGDGAA